MSDTDLPLLTALSTLLDHDRPASEGLLRAAADSSRHSAAVIPADAVRGSIAVRRLLARRRDTPADILLGLAGDTQSVVRHALIRNVHAPLEARRRSLLVETEVQQLRSHAEQLTDPDLLSCLASKARAQPRPTRGERWRFHRDDMEPTDEYIWEDVSGRLLANNDLPGDAGQELAEAMLMRLWSDLNDCPGSWLSSDLGAGSITWSGFRSWMVSHPERAQQLAEDSNHPWIVLFSATRPNSSPALVELAVDVHILPTLLDPSTDRGRVPSPLAGAILNLAPRLDAGTVTRLRTALSGYNLERSHVNLLAFVRPPRHTADERQRHAMFADGPVAEVLAYVEATRNSSEGRPSSRSVQTFIGRTDVSTSDALWVAGRYFNTGLDANLLIAARPFDRSFTLTLLARAPGTLRDVTDADLALDVVAAMFDPQVWGRRDDPTSCVPDETVALLGERLLELSWPAVARLCSRSPQVSEAVSSQLVAVLGSDSGRRLFANLSPTHTGTLDSLCAAVTSTLQPLAP